MGFSATLLAVKTGSSTAGMPFVLTYLERLPSIILVNVLKTKGLHVALVEAIIIAIGLTYV